jgi:hypothetical protein
MSDQKALLASVILVKMELGIGLAVALYYAAFFVRRARKVEIHSFDLRAASGMA